MKAIVINKADQSLNYTDVENPVLKDGEILIEVHAAALNRFDTVVRDYPVTRSVQEALYRLTETYLILGLDEEAQKSAAVLGYNYPESRWYKKAYALMKKYAPETIKG